MVTVEVNGISLTSKIRAAKKTLHFLVKDLVMMIYVKAKVYRIPYIPQYLCLR